MTAGGSLSGEFNDILLPTFTNPALYWDTSDLYTDGTIAAVPEPMTWVLLLSLGVMLLARYRFRRA